MDVDDLFVYDAPKTIRIRDARLGLLYLVLVTAIAIYIFVFQLLRDNSYLAYQNAAATTRLSLQQPTLAGCNPNDANCNDAFPPTDSLSYCCTSVCRRGKDGSCLCPGQTTRSYDCQYLDGSGASTVYTDTIVVATYVKEYTQSRNQSCGESGCTRLWNTTATSAFYTAGIGGFTVLVDHSLSQTGMGIYRTNGQMRGYLLINGSLPTQHDLCRERSDAVTEPVEGEKTNEAPCYIEPNMTTDDQLDIFTVATLLQAGGVTLDTVASKSGQPLRYQGSTVTLDVQYFNTWRWSGILKQVSYIYTVATFTDNAYKATEVVWLRYPDQRVRRSVHGVRLTVVPTGRLGTFDFQTLLLTLTTSLTLLALGATVVRYLALYVLKHRGYYQEMLIQVSADFSDVRALEAMPDNDLLAVLRQRRLPTGGTREQRILRILQSGRLWEGSHATAEGLPPTDGLHFLGH